MRFLLLLTLVLITSTVFSEDLIIRTKETGFYALSQSEIDQLNLNKSRISMGDLSIIGKNGVNPYFFTSNKSKLKANDNVVFFAETLKGELTRQHELDDLNGFRLSDSKLKTKDWFYNKSANRKLPVCKQIQTQDHYEVNKYLIRVNTNEYLKDPELWYWEQLSYLLKDGFSVPIEISRMDLSHDIYISASFRSRNKDVRAKNVPDHQVQLILNGSIISTFEWNGKDRFTSEKLKIPKELLKPEGNVITFMVPKRLVDKKSIVDASMLDYFEIDFAVDPAQITASDLLTSEEQCKVMLDDNQFAYSNSEKKYAFKSVELNPQSQVYIGNKDILLAAKLEKDSFIDADFADIEYLMITNPLFKKSTQVLADFYNEKGINTTIIETDQIYKKYSFGITELHPIKDLIKEIHTQGNGKLTHVLLVGDSSWDWRDNGENNQYGTWANRNDITMRIFTNFVHQKKYTSDFINRNFVPTGQYHSPEGHSASDNWFVSIIPEKNMKGEDYIPDLAIGRFPGSTPKEIDAMVAKTIKYTNDTKVGPWKSRILWITNSDTYYQNNSIQNAKSIEKHGVVANNVFPSDMDNGILEVQQTLSSSFDEGNLITHFIGHGGKSIWRVGPQDLRKNRDLFTLDHISKLQNSNRLPFVMSMSCYSAPFDHPFADSIGEKFIREPEVGAVAVLASSWRNAPNTLLSRYILESLYEKPQQSIGQAILEGKRRYKGRIMVEMYNLLGDPALKLAIPSLKMTSSNNQGEIDVKIDTDSFQGKALIETIDINANVLSSKEIDVTGNQFNFKIEESNPDCHLGKIYVWDSEQNIDAMSSFTCNESE